MGFKYMGGKVNDTALSDFISRNIDDSFVIPNDITQIGDGVFCCCPFTVVNIPSNITLLCQYAFYNSRSILNVTCANVQQFNAAVFNYCTRLTKIFIATTVVPWIVSTSVFSNNADNRIFIIRNDAELKTAYQTATNWSVFIDVIYTADEALAANLITQEEYNQFLEVCEND